MIDYSIGKTIFKDYKLQRYIDECAYGKVYLVKNEIGIPFALKALHKDVEMEKRGMASVMKLQSNRLVSILDYGKTVADQDCILMVY
jgi:serine/threonine protein kinase